MTEAQLVHGLVVVSDVPLPGAPVPHGMAVDVRVRRGPPPFHAEARPRAAPLHVSEQRVGAHPVLVADRPWADATLRLRYAEGITFVVAADGRTVWCWWEPPLTDADAAAFLLGPVLGVVLRRHGRLALHASAVMLGAGAVAFIGPAGSGKSTLAAALALRGHALVSEDLVAVRRDRDRWVASPGHRGIRLWDDAAQYLLGHTELPAVTPSWPKRALATEALPAGIVTEEVPLLAVCVLEDPRPADEPPRLQPEPAPALLVELVANVYVNYLATGDELARELGAVRHLASVATGWRLHPGHGADGLERTARLLAARAL